jgi:hypothetical protein
MVLAAHTSARFADAHAPTDKSIGQTAYILVSFESIPTQIGKATVGFESIGTQGGKATVPFGSIGPQTEKLGVDSESMRTEHMRGRVSQPAQSGCPQWRQSRADRPIDRGTVNDAPAPRATRIVITIGVASALCDDLISQSTDVCDPPVSREKQCN